ncbi:MAG: HEPN domain-containing protein [Spirochaetia bacterium]|jgi:HEPN domain-containing protein
MSAEKNLIEAGRWLVTAREDLETAIVLARNGRHAHACFHSHQAGEKALKAVWGGAGSDPWGHSLRKLLEDLRLVSEHSFVMLGDLVEEGARLDRYYVPTRYPNGLPDITPDMAYFQSDAEHAINLAKVIIDRVAALVRE